MTRLSSPMLYQCCKCAGYFTHSVLTFLHFYNDAPEWSDGRSGQWWANWGAPVGRCPVCSTVVWVEDALIVMPVPRVPRSIGFIARLWYRVTGDRGGRLRADLDWNARPGAIKHARPIDGLDSVQDLLDALAVVLPSSTADRETYLRRRLWWSFNDHLRAEESKGAEPPLHRAEPVAACANMHRLLALIERDPSRQVERGELLRQLGRFDEAVAVLMAVQGDGDNKARAIRIEGLARQYDSRMRQLGKSV